MGALPVHQSPTLLQIIDSRAGLFWRKKGLVVNAGKMNIYLKNLHLHQLLGYLLLNVVQYAAKRSAFWCKTHCVLMLNARQNGAKCGAICC